jgi:1-acyl-sn-glycerol-3-phosphate acyltransferase
MIGWIRLVIALFCVAVSTLVLVPLQLLSMKTGWYDEGLIRRLWHRINVKALGFRVHLNGTLTDKRPLLIASNHISWTDIEVMASIFDISFIAKSDIDDWPFIGRLFRLQRPVYVQRHRKRKSGEQASEVARRLGANQPIVLFPEGSTGDGNMLLRFKSTLFGAAAKAIAEGATEKVYIQPVAIAYTRIHGIPMGRQHRSLASWIGDQELVPHLKGLLLEGAIDVELHFGEPIEFAAGTSRKDASRQVESRVNDMMQAALRDPRPGA